MPLVNVFTSWSVPNHKVPNNNFETSLLLKTALLKQTDGDISFYYDTIRNIQGLLSVYIYSTIADEKTTFQKLAQETPNTLDSKLREYPLFLFEVMKINPNSK